MSLALRYGASGSFFLVAILLAATLFLPVEHVDTTFGSGRVGAGMWGMGGGLQDKGGNTTYAGSWYAPQFADASGLLALRLAGPFLLAGLLTLLVCGFMVLSGQGARTGWTATAGLVVGGIGMLLFLFGFIALAKSIGVPNAVRDPDIGPDVGFWATFCALLVGAGAALAAFMVKPEVLGRIGPDGQPLPPLPVLSVENPSAFNPMASREPRPFKQEDYEYRTFEVTGGPKTFKTAAEGAQPGAEPVPTDAWDAMEAQAAQAEKAAAKAAAAKPAPKAPTPAAKPPSPGGPASGKAVASSAPGDAKPAAKPAARPAASAPKPAAKPEGKPPAPPSKPK